MLEISRLLLVLVFAGSALAQTDTNSLIGKRRGHLAKHGCTPHKYRGTGAKVLKNMKREIEPCNNFYQFACGNFIERVQIPEYEVFADVFTQNTNTFVQHAKKIVRVERAETDPKPFKLPNKFYKSCMNLSLIESLADEPVRQIANSLGGWPVVVGRSWDSDNSWSWQELAKNLWRLGFNTDYIMDIRVGVDVKAAETRNLIHLREPSFLFKWDFYLSTSSKYSKFMIDTAVSFGASRLAALREIPKILKFEMALADICRKDGNIQFVDNLNSIAQLQTLYPYIQWLDFINAILPKGLTVDENETIHVISPDYFSDLGDLLARTEKRTIANYIMWKFHYFSMNFLSKEFRNKQQKFVSSFLNTPPEWDRGKECEVIVLESLPIATSSLYAHKYFKQDSKSAAAKIFENIRSAFMQTLYEAEWLDYDPKAKIKRKLHSMKAIIGFPDEVFDVGRMEEYHRELEIDENKYFLSYLNIRAFDLNKEFRSWRMPAKETEWREKATLSLDGPYSRIENNEIYIPPAYIQGQFFNIRRPNYMNYGSFGSALAFEIMHDFSGPGCKYCAEAREWWQSVSEQTLSEREKCFIEHYSNYTDKHSGLKIDGLQTLQANIADNSGVKFSYLAYKKWQAIHGVEYRLFGLKYTPQQLFWISFAQSFCGKLTPGEMEDRIKMDTSSPHEFRVLGVLRNLKEFSKDFHCPENSPMNPVQKCGIW